jgi:hypothetical protein
MLQTNVNIKMLYYIMDERFRASIAYILSHSYHVPEVEVEVTLRLSVSQSVSQSVSLGIEHPCGTCNQILLSVGMLLSEICGLVSVGRPLWREDGSAICSVITQ